MLCDACTRAFHEDDEDAREDADTSSYFLVPVRSRQSLGRAPSPVPSSPLYKATHHSLPKLIKSSADGCHLCILLWAAAPSEVRASWNRILQEDRPAYWFPCFITVDRAIFSPGLASTRKLLLEYKYQVGLEDPTKQVTPLKRHFRLFESQGVYNAPRLTTMSQC
jgi:hypothetical protein